MLLYYSLFHNGDIKQVCYSDHARTSTLHVPQELVVSYYKALTQFLKYVYSSDAMVQFKLQAGSMVTLNNYRILHDRTAFDIQSDSRRHLEGGHLDWDGVLSYMRVFERHHNINNKTPSM